MTHDPLCPNHQDPHEPCFACIVIAKVRADERAKAEHAWQRGYDTAQREPRA